MRYFRLLFITVLALSARAQASDDSITPQPEQALSTIHVTPSGTFLSYGESTLLMPGIQLSSSLVNTLITAGLDVTYSKIMHALLHTALVRAQPYISTPILISLGQGVIPLTYSLFQLYHTLPKLIKVAGHGWERTQTSLGWRRRGRMPVYTTHQLDKSVFIDFLIQSRESRSGRPYELEITPLQTVDTKTLFSPWQKTMGTLVNTALKNDIDLVRVFLDSDDGETKLEQHNRVTGEWQESLLYPAQDEDQTQFMHWLENSFWGTQADQAYTVLAPSGLNCITSRLHGNNSACPVLPTAIKQTDTTTDVFALSSEHNQDDTTYLHILGSRSWVPGISGSIVISDNIDVTEKDYQAQSHQYRMSRAVALIGESIAYDILRGTLHNTLDAGINYAHKSWYDLHQFKSIEEIEGGRSAGLVHRVRDREGKTWIRKYGPIITFQARYPLLVKEAGTLQEIDGNGSPRFHKTWLENAASPDARVVVLMEDGGNNLESLKPGNMDDMRKVLRGSLQALDSIHKVGFAHYDIKPENFVVNTDGDVKLIDFEMSSRMAPDGTALVSRFDPRWQSPEIEKFKPGSWRADIWSMGLSAVSLFSKSIMSGSEPQAAKLSKQLHICGDDPTTEITTVFSTSLQNGELFRQEPLFADFLKNMLHILPEKRQSAAELLTHPFLKQN